MMRIIGPKLFFEFKRGNVIDIAGRASDHSINEEELDCERNEAEATKLFIT